MSQNGDKVAQAVQQAEKVIHDCTDATDLSEKVIRDMGGAIEAMARRIWPMPPGNARYDLHDTLTAKSRHGDDLEKKFACIALPLIKHYRNPASHEFDTFVCTFDDARFFVQGIRVLLQVSRQIQTR